MKDTFWKVFAIFALLTILSSVIIHAISNRYTVQNKATVLDRWTGYVYRIEQRLK